MPKLSEDRALDLGSQLTAELSLMFLASIFGFNEYKKYKSRESEKDNEIYDFYSDSKRALDELDSKIQRQNEASKDIFRALKTLGEIKS